MSNIAGLSMGDEGPPMPFLPLSAVDRQAGAFSAPEIASAVW